MFELPAQLLQTGRQARKLTPEGRALQRRAAAIPPRIAGASGCTLDELSRLTARLQKLRGQLEHASPTAA